MKIGIEACGIFGWRGPGRNIRNLIFSLLEADKENEYYLFVDKEPQISFGHNSKIIIVKKRKFIPWLNLSLPLAVRRLDLDLFFFPQSNFWFYKPVKTIVYTRTAKINLPWSNSIYEKFQIILKNIFFKYMDGIICNSNFNRTQIELTTKIDIRKCNVVYNGVDPIFLDKKNEPFFGYGDYILFVGGTDNRKNIKNLLKAYEILIQKGIKENLVLVGGKYMYYEKALDQLISKLNSSKIIVHGVERNNKTLASLYRGSSLVVFPSFQEDFGNISVEAMASGIPLVASFMPSIPEVAGNAALYFDPYNIDEIASVIFKVLNDKSLRELLIRNGEERINKFKWETSAQKILDIFQKYQKSN